MKFYTFTICLAVLYSVAADFHLPEDPGFIPPASLANEASSLMDVSSLVAPAISEIPVAKEFNEQPSASDSINREFDRHMYSKINQLCSLLKNCNPVPQQYGSAPLNYNSVPPTNSYPSLPAPVPAMPVAPAPAPMPAMPVAPAPAPMPAMGFAAPAPPAPVPAMGYAAIPTPAPMGYMVPTTVRYPASTSGQTSYNIPALSAQMSYPTTTYRTVVLGNYYVPASPAAATPPNYNAPAPTTYTTATTMRPPVQSYGAPAPMAYAVTTMRPSAPAYGSPLPATMAPSYGAPMPATMAPYSVTTMRPPAPTSYFAPAPSAPSRPYPIAVSSGY